MRILISFLQQSTSILFLVIGITMATSYTSFGQDTELCENAIHLCGNEINGFSGRLPGPNDADTIWKGVNPLLNLSWTPKSGLCDKRSQFDNTVWYSFIVCDTILDIKVEFSNCVHPTFNINDTGMQGGLYKECDYNGSVDCDVEQQGIISGALNLSSNVFKPGDLALLVLDGFAGSTCDYRIVINKGVNSAPNPIPDPTSMDKGSITGPNVVSCRDYGIAKTYSITKPECQILYSPACTPVEPTQINGVDSIKWVWTVMPETGRFFQNNDSFGLTKDIVFTEKGKYTLSAKPIFHKNYGGICKNGACGEVFSWTVDVLEADTTIAAPIVLCPDETFVFCGNTISNDTMIYCEGINCQVTAQAISFRLFDDSNLGNNIVCNGDNFSFQGNTYSPGTYTVKDNIDCTKRYTFTVVEEVLGLNVMNSSSLLTCKDSIILSNATATSSSNLPLNYEWRNASNQILSTLGNTKITAPGTYSVDAYVSLVSGKKCIEREIFVINQDIEKPKVLANIPTVTCRSTTQQLKILSVNPSRPLISSTWTSPKGTNTNSLNIVVDSSNAVTGQAYKFSGVASNGCKVDTSFIVPVNFVKPLLTVDGEMLTCYNPSTVLTLNSNMPVDSIKWSFTSVGSTPVFCCNDNSFVTSPQNLKGTYSARARSTDSYCYNIGSKFIDENKIRPDLTLQGDTLWRCNTASIDLSPLKVSSGSEFDYQWSVLSGNLKGDKKSANIEASSEGYYVLSVFNKQNGCNKLDSIKINKDYNFPQSLNLQASDITCFGLNDGSVIINGHQSGGEAPFTYTLNGKTESIGSNINNLSAGIYKVVVSDKYACQDSVTFEIIEPSQLLVETEPSIELNIQESVVLDFTSTYDLADIKTINWFDKDGNLLGEEEELNYTGNRNDLLSLVVINENGCESRSEIKVIVDSDLKIFLPNAFSPNGDGINDVFSLFKNKVPAQTLFLNIYDRFGNQVFAAKEIDWNNKNAGWDGTFKGSRVEAGIYIATLSYIDYEGNNKVINSSVLVSY